MVRKYKPRPGHRQYKKYDPELIARAVKEITDGGASCGKTANKYKISKSSLYDRCRNKRMKRMGGQTAFSLEREEHMIKYINACAPWEYHLTSWDIRLLIKFYLDKRSGYISKRKFSNNLPGQDLVLNLLKRHEDTISQRIIQNMNNNETISIEKVMSYFYELKMSITDVTPDNIVCYNDILVTNDVDRNENGAEEINSNDVLVMTAASASGKMLLPYIVYKEKCYELVKKPRCKQPRHWLNPSIYENWFKSVIIPYFEEIPGRKCLIGRYFSSRISVKLLNICKEQNIDFIFMPNNSSELTQPLDSLSRLIQTTWNNVVEQTKTAGDQSRVQEEEFRKKVQILAMNANGKILEWFKRTGINPINPVEVLKLLPDYNETTVEDVDEQFENMENMKNISCDDTDLVQVKEEIYWSDEYNDYEEHLGSLESKIITGKKVASKPEGQIDLTQFDLKLSPTNLHDEAMNEDVTVDYIAANIMDINEVLTRSTKESKYEINVSGNTKEVPSHSRRNGTFYVQALSEKPSTANVVQSKPVDLDGNILLLIEPEKNGAEDISNITAGDPLSNCQNSEVLRTTISRMHPEGESSNHCVNGNIDTCHANTQLLESILASVRRQEKLQERTALAMEAQTLALTNIARLLERRDAGNTT